MSRTGLAALANLFVAFQALRHEWGYYETLLIYWAEVVILGGYNLSAHDDGRCVRRCATRELGGPVGGSRERSQLVLLYRDRARLLRLQVRGVCAGHRPVVLLLPAMLRLGGGGGASIPRPPAPASCWRPARSA